MTPRGASPEWGAAYPLRDWSLQRITGVLMVAWVFAFFGLLAAQPDASYQSWCAVFKPSPMRLATLFVCIAVCFHAWVGMRNIYMDYVKPPALRAPLKLATAGVLAAYPVWMALILAQLGS